MPARARPRVGCWSPAGTVSLVPHHRSEVRAAFGVGADGVPGLGIWDNGGTRIWQAPPPAERTP
jgi:hypothetical protein